MTKHIFTPHQYAQEIGKQIQDEIVNQITDDYNKLAILNNLQAERIKELENDLSTKMRALERCRETQSRVHEENKKLAHQNNVLEFIIDDKEKEIYFQKMKIKELEDENESLKRIKIDI